MSCKEEKVDKKNECITLRFIKAYRAIKVEVKKI